MQQSLSILEKKSMVKQEGKYERPGNCNLFKVPRVKENIVANG